MKANKVWNHLKKEHMKELKKENKKTKCWYKDKYVKNKKFD